MLASSNTTDPPKGAPRPPKTPQRPPKTPQDHTQEQSFQGPVECAERLNSPYPSGCWRVEPSPESIPVSRRGLDLPKPLRRRSRVDFGRSGESARPDFGTILRYFLGGSRQECCKDTFKLSFILRPFRGFFSMQKSIDFFAWKKKSNDFGQLWVSHARPFPPKPRQEFPKNAFQVIILCQFGGMVPERAIKS